MFAARKSFVASWENAVNGIIKISEQKRRNFIFISVKPYAFIFLVAARKCDCAF